MAQQKSLQERVEEKIRAVMAAAGSGIGPAVDLDARTLAAMIDHTLLKAEATREQVVQLCHEASEYSFAAVCVNASYVPLCCEHLAGTDVAVATVVGFPLGATLPEVKAYEAQRAISAGATEVDMVIHIGALKDKDYSYVLQDIATVVQACHAQNALLKVIIETAYLTDEDKVAACFLAQKAGADFVKTSTGFGPDGARVQDVALMRRTVGPDMGVKAAGGIRSYEDARAMAAAGATRIGASAGVKILEQARAKAG